MPELFKRFAHTPRPARGAHIIEGYPVSRKYGKEIPAAFAYTGVVPIFTDMGFNPTNKHKSWRQRVRKDAVGRRKSSKNEIAPTP